MLLWFSFVSHLKNTSKPVSATFLCNKAILLGKVIRLCASMKKHLVIRACAKSRRGKVSGVGYQVLGKTVGSDLIPDT
jgi:hypothetical protein